MKTYREMIYESMKEALEINENWNRDYGKRWEPETLGREIFRAKLFEEALKQVDFKVSAKETVELSPEVVEQIKTLLKNINRE